MNKKVSDRLSGNAALMTSERLPIAVDLDGTLIQGDTLVESIIQLIKKSPLNLIRLFYWFLFLDRAGFKEAVASRSIFSPKNLPYRELFLEYLRAQRADGRRIILATAAHHSIANEVARHLGIFDDVISTDKNNNLKGIAKLEAIQKKLGENFVYAGDSTADIPIWHAAQAAILVGVSSRLASSIRRKVRIEKEFFLEDRGFSIWLRAFRVHQWLKNLLLFVPMLTAFSFTRYENIVTMAIAFLSFSFAASATYIINDFWDLESDRKHPRKRHRPFASGKLPIVNGFVVSACILSVAFLLAYAVSLAFFLMVILYVVLTTAYSLALKEIVLIDVIMLSILYTLRILAGSVAINIATSSWLLAFSMFVFLSLALVKRCSELVSLELDGKAAAHGRDYKVRDLVVLWPLGVASALSAVVVFGLFISAPDTQSRYSTPALLWLVAIGLVYWLGRLWIKTARGEMHDDPIIFAIRDKVSKITVVAMILTMIFAHFIILVKS